jgi:hypothetical protein
MWWKGLGEVNWRRVGECVGFFGGFSPCLYARLLPKMANKINAIEYSGGTGSILDANQHHEHKQSGQHMGKIILEM